MPSRRAIIRAGFTLAGSLCALPRDTRLARLCAQAQCDDGPRGELLDLVPLYGDRPSATPFGRILGGPGLDSRLFTDLSQLAADRLITPTSQVFIGTTAPSALAGRRDAWTIKLGGAATSQLTVSEIERRARPMRAHLIECSGNNDPDNFGLLSVPEWDGVPLATVLADVARGFSLASHRRSFPANAWGVLVKGFDEHTEPTRSSVPGRAGSCRWRCCRETLPRFWLCA